MSIPLVLQDHPASSEVHMSVDLVARVLRQQPGVAIRKELFRRRGLIKTARVRHPGASLSSLQSKQLDDLLRRVLRDVNITRPIDQGEVAFHDVR